MERKACDREVGWVGEEGGSVVLMACQSASRWRGREEDERDGGVCRKVGKGDYTQNSSHTPATPATHPLLLPLPRSHVCVWSV